MAVKELSFDGIHKLQGGSNMTGTDLYKRTHKSVLVIFEPPCILYINTLRTGDAYLRFYITTVQDG